MPASNLIQLLDESTQKFGNKNLYVFLDGKPPFQQTPVTYSHVRQSAIQIASQLQMQNVNRGRVLLLFPSDLDYVKCFWGVIYSGAVAVPMYPPTASKHIDRLLNVIADAQCQYVLTTKKIYSALKILPGSSGFFKAAQFLFLEDLLITSENAKYQPPETSASDTVFLQYTSGSTGLPKGVMLTHSNLIENVKMIVSHYEVTSNDIGISWLPLHHDMGLIGGCIMIAAMGMTNYLMDPRTIVRPKNWLSAISQFKCTMAMAPNFGYERCLTHIPDDQITDLNLSSLRMLSNGSEPIRVQTMNDFITKFSAAKINKNIFFPSYGLAEATLIVTAKKRWQSEFVKKIEGSNLLYQEGTVVNCGSSAAGTRVEIADIEKQHLVSAGTVGEILVSGPSVAHGYWNNPELSEKTFKNQIDSVFYLRTGDLGFKDAAGDLFIVGRIKDVIKINGKNYYSEDIEAVIKDTDSGLRNSIVAVFGIFETEQEKIVALIEAHNSSDLLNEKIKARFIEEDLPQIQITFVKPKSIKRTTSGKIRRQETKNLFISGKIRERSPGGVLGIKRFFKSMFNL